MRSRASSPLLVKLSDHLLGREVELDLGRAQMVVPEESLQRRQRNISLYGGDGEGMPQDMWAHRTADVGEVRHALDDALNGAGAHPKRIVQRKVSHYEGLYPCRERDNPALGFAALGSTLSVNHEKVPLPVNVVTAEA